MQSPQLRDATLASDASPPTLRSVTRSSREDAPDQVPAASGVEGPCEGRGGTVSEENDDRLRDAIGRPAIAESETGSSEERDDSDDEDFSPQSESEADEEEVLTADSGPTVGNSEEEDIGNFLFDTGLHLQGTGIIRSDECGNNCARGKAKEFEMLLCSLSQMTKLEKNTSLYKLLAVLMQVPVDRKRGSGDRERVHY
ncbi:unnamed protein product [Phytophthora lilii]|uniref:Unnamed protein product n=1 Tax=Phytophthora lilii TaxID=2077276 RepID=A0A9W7CHW2_9STRA|nr:unnamed protein product [Phytophthora lilii]